MLCAFRNYGKKGDEYDRGSGGKNEAKERRRKWKRERRG